MTLSGVAASTARWAVVGASRRTGLDITDRSAVCRTAPDVRPAAVINVAAVAGQRGRLGGRQLAGHRTDDLLGAMTGSTRV